MKYLLIPLIWVLSSAKITLQSGFSKKNNKGLADNVFFNAVMFSAVAVLFTPALITSGVTGTTLLFGAIMGVLSVAFQIFYLCAFARGKVSLTVIINNFSMLIPMVVSMILYQEPFGPMKLLGTLLALLSFCLNVSRDKPDGNAPDEKKKNRTRTLWLVFTLLVFLCNGLASINQKIYSKLGQPEIFGFVAIAYLTASLLSWAIFFIINRGKKCTLSRRPKAYLTAGASGFFLGTVQCLNTYATSVIDGTIFFPTINCGISIMLTAIGWILFGERLTGKQLLGVAIGLVSIILLCF